MGSDYVWDLNSTYSPHQLGCISSCFPVLRVLNQFDTDWPWGVEVIPAFDLDTA